MLEYCWGDTDILICMHNVYDIALLLLSRLKKLLMRMNFTRFCKMSMISCQIVELC